MAGEDVVMTDWVTLLGRAAMAEHDQRRPVFSTGVVVDRDGVTWFDRDTQRAHETAVTGWTPPAPNCACSHVSTNHGLSGCADPACLCLTRPEDVHWWAEHKDDLPDLSFLQLIGA